MPKIGYTHIFLKFLFFLKIMTENNVFIKATRALLTYVERSSNCRYTVITHLRISKKKEKIKKYKKVNSHPGKPKKNNAYF